MTPPPPELAAAIADSVRYLGSDAALASLARDVYWPKWHSPWWHMTLLWELGHAREIPARASAAVIAGIDRLRHTMPITVEECAGVDLQRDVACHCALGTMAQVLAACGHDVDTALPWIAPWLRRYQMADGGLNCDEEAYRVADECPSSMVGTIAAFEARRDDRAFATRAASFMLARELVDGSPTRHNADERDAAPAWRELTFPRFYFYDVLRGLTALARWAKATGAAIPPSAVARAVAIMDGKPAGALRIERQAFAGRQTITPRADGSSGDRTPTTSFPLLAAVSALGAASPTLTREWTETRALLVELGLAPPRA